MNANRNWRERSIWLVVIAALSTSLMWLAIVCVVALSHGHVVPAQAFVLARALAVAAGDVVGHLWPALPLLALGSMMLAFVVRGPIGARREVRHD
jgi:hypothetical protein